MDLMSAAQLLGNFGEFFAALAVFVTLGYLAVQVRETRQSLVRQNERSLTADAVTVSLKMVDSPHLAKIYTTGVGNWQDLTQEDGLVLHMYLWSLFSCLEHATIDKATGRFESDLLNVYGEGLVNIIRAPGGRDWYENNRSLFTEDLQDYIAKMLPKGHRSTFDVFNISAKSE